MHTQNKLLIIIKMPNLSSVFSRNIYFNKPTIVLKVTFCSIYEVIQFKKKIE